MTVETSAPAGQEPEAKPAEEGTPEVTPAPEGDAKKEPTILSDAAKGKDGEPAAPAPVEGEGEPKPLEITLPDGVTPDEGLLGWFKDAAVAAELDSDKASAMVGAFTEYQRDADEKAVAKYEAQAETWKKELKEELGEKYDATVAGVNRLCQSIEGGREFAQTVESFGLGNHPVLIKFLATVAKATSEDDSSSKNDTGGSSGLSPDEKWNKAVYPNS